MNIHVLDRFDEIYYDLNQVTIEDVYIKNRDQTRIEFNSINFKNSKPRDMSFHEYFFEPLDSTSKCNAPEARFYLKRCSKP